MGLVVERAAVDPPDEPTRRDPRRGLPVRPDPAALRRTRRPPAPVPSPLLAVQRMVYPGWGAGDCRAVLFGPSAPRETGTGPDARGRGRDPGVVHAHFAA